MSSYVSYLFIANVNNIDLYGEGIKLLITKKNMEKIVKADYSVR